MLTPGLARCTLCRRGLNESPSEKEGKSRRGAFNRDRQLSLNESPSEKEGKSPVQYICH